MALGYDRFFGFNTTQRHTLENLLAAAALTEEQEVAIALVASIPTTDPAVVGEIWNDNGTLVVSEGP